MTDSAEFEAERPDFDRSLPQFEGWPESLAEPKLDFGVNDDCTVRTTLTVEGQGELFFWTDSSDRADYEHFEGNFDDVDEEVLEQAVEWASAKHLEIDDAVMGEMKAAGMAARGRVLSGLGMESSAPSDLVELATMLDEARLAANANDATAPDPGVYGHISRALRGTLVLTTGNTRRAESIYASLISDGVTVAEALEHTAGGSE